MPHKDRETRLRYAREAAAKRRKENPEKVRASLRAWWIKNKVVYKPLRRAYDLQRLYGLTVEQFEKLVFSQHHLCALCGEQAPRLVVDHCHVTGRVRGLLCDRCNRALGHFKDQIELIEKALLYLKRPAEKRSIDRVVPH